MARDHGTDNPLFSLSRLGMEQPGHPAGQILHQHDVGQYGFRWGWTTRHPGRDQDLFGQDCCETNSYARLPPSRSSSLVGSYVGVIGKQYSSRCLRLGTR
jgi:hypothetical protein